ncbi:MAG: hypothetical protein KKB79_03220, partial [Nanoarchaeota archaeon]|nr:hypothetical protein [Nanoarchaeota archaeon]
EIFEDLMDIDGAKTILKDINENKIKMKIIETKVPSPFAIHLVMQGHTDLLRIEDKQSFLRRMHELHMKDIIAKGMLEN